MEIKNMTKNAAERAKKIKIFLMDVDGVLTDGKMYYLPGRDSGMVEFKAFHALDGIGLRLLNQFGVVTGVITGCESPGTEERARDLGMSYAYQGFLSKVDPLERILADTGLAPENVAYMGDDWTDIPVLKRAGLACAPANALDEVKAALEKCGVAPTDVEEVFMGQARQLGSGPNPARQVAVAAGCGDKRPFHSLY